MYNKLLSPLQFNNLELDDVELNYVVQEFLELMVQECNEYPGQWTFSNLHAARIGHDDAIRSTYFN